MGIVWRRKSEIFDIMISKGGNFIDSQSQHDQNISLRSDIQPTFDPVIYITYVECQKREKFVFHALAKDTPLSYPVYLSFTWTLTLLTFG